MAKTPETVNEFLADLQSRLTSSGLNAIKRLKDLKKAHLQSKEEKDQHDYQVFL
jgi:metallopeptidase MepB